MVQEACRELQRSPQDAAEVLRSLEQDWVTDLRDLAALSDAGWQYLRVPAMLKVVLRRRCDELYELVPQLRNPESKGTSTSPNDGRSVSFGKGSVPSWRNAKGKPWGNAPLRDSRRETALSIETDRGEAAGERSDLVEALRRNLRQAGVNSLREINRFFGKGDVSRDGTLSRPEFDRLIKELRIPGIDAPQKVHALWNVFDRDRNGVVSSSEFLRTVRGRMSPSREASVKQAFDLLDTGRTGVVQRKDVLMNFDPFPEATERGVSAVDVLHNFLEIGRESEGQPKSVVSTMEFLAYYDNVSAIVDDDAEFAKIVRETWPSSTSLRHTHRYAVGPRFSQEETSHSAAAICRRIRQRLATSFTGRNPERQVARAIWQLTHSASDDINVRNGMRARLPGALIERDSFDHWIEELHSRSLPEVDRQILFEVIDLNGDGLVQPTDFLCALQGSASKRQALIEDSFLRISNSAGNISWEHCKIPDDLLELLSMTHGSEPISKDDFALYYLSCGVLLQDDRALESLLLNDWPGVGKSSSMQGAAGSVGSVASIAKGLGTVNPRRAWLSLAGDLQPGSARPGRHGSISLDGQSVASNRSAYRLS